ncbi:MAG: RluA family pseudouridine synthase [Muribaculaceae bacterium]|nr:RluA family pseudouridine synthase [Muribaculaceae bacterium]
MPENNFAAYSTFTVKEPCALIDFLLKAKDGASRTKIKGILSGGGVLVNGETATQFNLQLKPGDTVQVSRRKTATSERRTADFMRIVYEDRYLVVVDKQPGILSMATPHHPFSVKTLLDDHFKKSGQKCTAHVVHRLDRDTSGLMVYAKSMDCRLRFESDWKGIVYDRRYVALVCGRMTQKNGTLQSWLKDDNQFFTHSYSHDIGGCKWAVTHFTTLQAGAKTSLVELRLDTGRKNQIRVHMGDLGFPVAGDEKYGARINPAGRMCLHAIRLCFTHPYTGEPMEFSTPIPRAFVVE